MPFAEGENIGPYRIMEKLGQGGMATVYKAYHAKLDRYVAMKVLHPAFGEDQNFEARFQREAQVVARLDHPNIVPVYDYAEYEHRPYLVMKFIEGETLKAHLANSKLSPEEIGKIVDSVGAALAYAHEQGILHRDVKPSNVLLSNDGQIYLADFGLARIAQAGESTLSSDVIMGTPQYISPEQARGDKDLDAGTDIYSFGVLLYELITGQVPFNADTPFSVIHDHIYTPLPLPRSLNPEVPESVERVLLKALAKERADRYETVAEMVQAFQRVYGSIDVPVTEPGETFAAPTMKPAAARRQKEKRQKAKDVTRVQASQEPKPKKKRSVWMYIAAGILSVLCFLVALSALGEMRQNRQNESGEQPLPITATVEQPVPTEGPTEPGEMKPEDPPELIEAERRAGENPDDPYAQLNLSIAYWDAGHLRPAFETLDRAAELGGEDVDFLILAGDQFHKRQAWVFSAAMYLRAIRRIGPGDKPAHLVDSFHESAYNAVLNPEVGELSPFIEEIIKVDEPIGLVVKARYVYFNGNHEDGWTFLSEAQRLNQDYFEARLLEGEFALAERRFGDTRNILEPLTREDGVPEWIIFTARELLQQIP